MDPFKQVLKPWQLTFKGNCWSTPTKNFNNPAVMNRDARFLHVEGTAPLPVLSKDATYRISFKVGMGPDSRGWEDTPIFLMAKIGKEGKYKWTRRDISGIRKASYISMENQIVLKHGENLLHQDRMLYFGMYEKWKNNYKRGLIIYEVKVEEVALPANQVDQASN